MDLDFSSLNNFFSSDNEKKNTILYEWGQEHLLPLQGKLLEKACSELTLYFRKHPEAELCKNLILPELYWRDREEHPAPNHYHLNYGFKEYLMNVIIYRKCEYVHFTKDNDIEWDNESKKPRFIYRDTKDRKTQPNQKLDSNYTLKQKDTVWAGIAIGFLDVTIPEKSDKKTDKKTKDNDKKSVNKTIDKKDVSKKEPKHKALDKKNKKSEKDSENIVHEIYDENHNINNAVTDKSLDSIDEEQSEGHEEYEYYIQSNNHRPIHEKASKILKKTLLNKELPHNNDEPVQEDASEQQKKKRVGKKSQGKENIQPKIKQNTKPKTQEGITKNKEIKLDSDSKEKKLDGDVVKEDKKLGKKK